MVDYRCGGCENILTSRNAQSVFLCKDCYKETQRTITRNQIKINDRTQPPDNKGGQLQTWEKPDDNRKL